MSPSRGTAPPHATHAGAAAQAICAQHPISQIQTRRRLDRCLKPAGAQESPTATPSAPNVGVSLHRAPNTILAIIPPPKCGCADTRTATLPPPLNACPHHYKEQAYQARAVQQEITITRLSTHYCGPPNPSLNLQTNAQCWCAGPAMALTPHPLYAFVRQRFLHQGPRPCSTTRLLSAPFHLTPCGQVRPKFTCLPPTPPPPRPSSPSLSPHPHADPLRPAPLRSAGPHPSCLRPCGPGNLDLVAESPCHCSRPVHPCPPAVARARPLASVPCRRLGPRSPRQRHVTPPAAARNPVHCPAAALAAFALASCSMTLAVGRSSVQLCSVARIWPKEGRAVGCSAQQLVMRALTAGSRSAGSGMRWPWKPTVPTTCKGPAGYARQLKEVLGIRSRLPEEKEVVGRRVSRAGDAAYKARAWWAVARGRCAAGFNRTCPCRWKEHKSRLRTSAQPRRLCPGLNLHGVELLPLGELRGHAP